MKGNKTSLKYLRPIFKLYLHVIQINSVKIDQNTYIDLSQFTLKFMSLRQIYSGDLFSSFLKAQTNSCLTLNRPSHVELIRDCFNLARMCCHYKMLFPSSEDVSWFNCWTIIWY